MNQLQFAIRVLHFKIHPEYRLGPKQVKSILTAEGDSVIAQESGITIPISSGSQVLFSRVSLLSSAERSESLYYDSPLTVSGPLHKKGVINRINRGINIAPSGAKSLTTLSPSHSHN